MGKKNTVGKRKSTPCLFCGAPIFLSEGKHYTITYDDKAGNLTVEYYCNKSHAPDTNIGG